MSNSQLSDNNESLSQTGVMFKIWHHFGDWDMETKHMTRIEKSIYFDMRTLYLNQGQPLTDDLTLLQRRLSCRSDEEKQALDFVLLDKFKHCKKSKSYKHKEWDLILKNYRWKHRKVGNASNEFGNDESNASNESSNAQSNAERQAIFKQKRLEMIQALRNIGLEVANNVNMAELKPLYEQYFNDMSNNVGNVTSNASNEKVTYSNDEVTADNEKNRANNQEPITSNQEPRTKKEIMTAQAEEIFEFWKSVFGKDGSTKFSDKRKAKVTARLKDGYTIDEIKQAIVNVSKNDFNVANGYTDLELICRDVEHLERYRDLKPQTQANLHLEQPKHIQDLKVNDAWDRQPPTQLPELDEEYWFMREQIF